MHAAGSATNRPGYDRSRRYLPWRASFRRCTRRSICRYGCSHSPCWKLRAARAGRGPVRIRDISDARRYDSPLERHRLRVDAADSRSWRQRAPRLSGGDGVGSGAARSVRLPARSPDPNRGARTRASTRGRSCRHTRHPHGAVVCGALPRPRPAFRRRSIRDRGGAGGGASDSAGAGAARQGCVRPGDRPRSSSGHARALLAFRGASACRETADR